ncbi:hypothetical protein CP963_01580 [Arcobacter cloacae]|uniref:Autotransporter domain-containing protein n=1 Tax=Arcobacter cloacae TaxID=1054034 RepID=A0AA94FI91_9BACT|nr:autotransporter domain-containing protein [Arcobacter cloacae]RXI42733.1 hypothetical protein CP963_01580 [Arcobacter cloacae]
MNSFRVIDTRFRILKGGKIGLSLSISLIGSALVFGSVNSYAVDYFTDVQSTISDSTTTPSGGTNLITVQKALNSGSINSTRTETDTNPVVFKPTSWANSSYTDPTFSPEETSPYFPARYNLGKQDFSSLELNLTFNTGATSGSISKNSTTFYSANITPPGYIADNSGIPTQTLTSVVSNNYKANLIFEGSNTVSGSTNIEDGNIEIKGNVNFQGTVTAGSIDVDTTDTAIFGSNVSLASGGGTLNFSQNGNIILNSNFSGNITTTTTGAGNITTIGNNTINGNIGSSSSSLNSLNIGDLTNISNTTINGDVFANSTVLNNTTTNSSTLILSNDKNITSTITTSYDNKGILTLSGGTQTVTGQVGTDSFKLAEVNTGYGTTTFQNNVYATNLDVEGTGTVNLNGSFTGTAIRYNADGTANLYNGLTGNVTTSGAGTGTLNLVGSNNQTVNGNVGVGNALKDVNSGVNGTTSTFAGTVNSQNITNTGTGTTIFQDDVNATNVNVNAGTSNFEDNLTAISTTITTGIGNFNTLSGTTSSNIVFTGDGTANLYNGLTGNVTTSGAGTGTLNLVGSNNQTVNGNVGVGNALKDVNSGVNGTTSTFAGTVNSQNITNTGTGTTIFQDDVNATNVNVNAGTSNFEDNLTAISTTITTGIGNFNTLSGTTSSNIVFGGIGEVNLNNGLDGNINFANYDATVNIINGDITGNITSTGTNGNLNISGTTTISGTVDTENITNIGTGTTIFQDDVIATNVNVNAGTSTFEDNLTATTTTITTGIGNFNTLSGTTSSNIVFTGDGTANLNEGLIGNIYFSGNDAIVNVSDGKGILGSVETLANNTGILNFKGDGVIDGIIGSASLAIKELNVNSENEQDKDGNGTVITQGLLAHREIFAEIINLRNNATLTLANNANVTKTSTGLVISTDNANSGNVVFLGSSTVTGEVGTNNNNLESITAGANDETVTFNDMVYASILNYSDDGTVVLNGDNSSNANAEGFKGTVNFDSFAGKLEIGDDVNLTIGTAGTQFVNANNATLTFNGTSNVLGNIGSENGVNDTFKTINAGASNETVKFEDNIYVMDSLNLSSNGKVQIADGNYVKRNSNSTTTGAMITTSTNGFGDLEYLGSTILHSDIGTSSSKLNNVTFASTGNTSNIYNQDIDKNVYALNTYIGNGSNKTTLNIKEDITFGGNLNLRKDSVLNVSDYNVTVDNNLNIASNSTLNFKVNATDLEGLASSTYGNYGSINSTSLTIDNDSEIHISYVGTLNGTDTYDLIRTSNIILTNYEGTELNGLVSDDSIVNSIVKNVGNNLVLFVDRTGGGSFAAEDLYIEKSGIGKDYSNGASRSLAGYAKEQDRAGALTDIVRKMEYFEGGTNLSEAKKQEMIKMQRLLAPTANNSNIQSTITATNLSASTIKGRLSDIRVTQGNNFTPNTYNYLGLSSGDYYSFDTSFWLKAMASKATQDKIKEYDGYDSSTYGFVGGMDKITNDGSIFGVALSYSTTKIKQDGLRTDDSDTTSVQTTLYSSQEIGDAYVDGYLSYGKHKTDATRTANSGKLNSSVNSDQISAKVETGYKIPLNDGISLTPFASLEYSLLNQKGYTEKGTTYQNDALKVDSIKLNRGTAEVGAKLVTNIEFDDTLIIPQFSASVYNSFGDNKPDVKAQFVGGGNKFVTPVPMMNDTMINLGLGVETKISDSTSLIFDVDYDRSKDGKFEAYSGSVTFGVSF